MQFSKIIIYTFINTILTRGRDDVVNQNDAISSVDDNQTHHKNDDRLAQITSSPASYPSSNSSTNLSKGIMNYLGILCIPIIMFL